MPSLFIPYSDLLILLKQNTLASKTGEIAAMECQIDSFKTKLQAAEQLNEERASKIAALEVNFLYFLLKALARTQLYLSMLIGRRNSAIFLLISYSLIYFLLHRKSSVRETKP